MAELVTLNAMRSAGSAYLPTGDLRGRVELEVAGGSVALDLDGLVC